MVTSVPPSETFSLIKNNILHQSKNYKNHFKYSNFWGMWPKGHVGYVPYSLINMLFKSTGIFDDKLRPQILSVGTTANSPLRGRRGRIHSPITTTVVSSISDKQGVLDTTLSDQICQWLATGWCFSPITMISPTNKTDHHDITEILLKVALNTITITHWLIWTSIVIYKSKAVFFYWIYVPINIYNLKGPG